MRFEFSVEPEEAEVRTFRGMLTGQTRGFLSGLKKLGKKLFGGKRRIRNRRRGRKLYSKRPLLLRKRPRMSKNKLLLTGKNPSASIGALSPAWMAKLNGWNWRSYAKFGSEQAIPIIILP